MTVESEVYRAIIAFCEEMERWDTYQGSGHHLAQNIASLVAKRGTLVLDSQVEEAPEGSGYRYFRTRVVREASIDGEHWF